jgi:hypothetical protein
MVESKEEKIKEFIESTHKIQSKGYLYEEERKELSSKIIGFLRGAFSEKREADYLRDINRSIRASEMSLKKIFEMKTRQMREFLIITIEEVRAREAFQAPTEISFDKLEKDVKKNKLENERRKNVAEFKAWGFAIELVDTVRKELKQFKHVQEELLVSINGLRKELKESKK